MTGKPSNTIDMLWQRVEPAEAMDCWIWTGLVGAQGYGRFSLFGKEHAVHRLTYEQLRAEIPPGLQIDHLCRNRRCVNPWHMEPVTIAENVRRGEAGVLRKPKTHCPHGHEYTPENTYKNAGRRFCRECHRIAGNLARARRRT